MIYELRVYRVVQGRMVALLTRFEHQTLPIMVRHGILQVGVWTTIGCLGNRRIPPVLVHTAPDGGVTTSDWKPSLSPTTEALLANSGTRSGLGVPPIGNEVTNQTGALDLFLN